jgi:hypothetical protein
MPHDKNGVEVKPGDIVTVRFKVKEVQQTEDYCNVTMETESEMLPNGGRTGIVLNAAQTEKV